MAMKPGLGLHQSQRLALTPALRQSINILQLSSTDLAQLVQSALSENPVLTAENEHETAGNVDFIMALETVSQPVSRSEALQKQIAVMRAPVLLRQIADYLANDLSEDGFLIESPDETAETLGVQPHMVEQAILLLQKCEPTGIGAQNLKDSLDIQLAAQGVAPDTRSGILDNLAMFAEGNLNTLSKKLSLGKTELENLVGILKSLNPAPGRTALADETGYLVPDILVEPSTDGGFLVNLARSTTPALQVDQSVLNQLKDKDTNTFTYLNDQRADARALIRAIEARSKMILRVAKVIVAHQFRFFQDGQDYLSPLTRAEIAETLSIHPSTVTRAVANKALECAFGVYPLSFFFSATLGATDGETQHSARAIQNRIRKTIAAESAKRTLSDDAIATILRESGVDISRRTVAKYRQCLNIPTSAERRRSKRAL
jgi:RNA polymerase sigma-54 factor